MKSLLQYWNNSNQFLKMILDLKGSSSRRGLVYGLEGAQRDFFVSAWFENTEYNHIFIVTPDMEHAERMYQNITTFLPGESIHIIPPRDMIIAEELIAQSKEIKEQRFKALEEICNPGRMVLICPIASLMQRMMPPEKWNKYVLTLEIDSVYGRESLTRHLAAAGYERVSMIEGKGEFSVRGSLVDVYPVGRENPVRIEFFDDLVESIREFDHHSQRSVASLQGIRILPASEVVLEEKVHKAGLDRIKDTLAAAMDRMEVSGKEDIAAKLKNKVNKHLQALHAPVLNEGMYGYFSFFYGTGSSLLDYLDDSSLVVLEDEARIKERAWYYHRNWRDFYASLLQEGVVLPSEVEINWSYDELLPPEYFPCLYLDMFIRQEQSGFHGFACSLESKNASTFYGQWELLKDEIMEYKRKNYRVFLTVTSEEKKRTLKERMKELEVDVAGEPAYYDSDTGLNSPVIITGNLTHGFELPSLKLAVITEKDMLPPQKVKKQQQKKKDEGARVKHYSELGVGDYVVHQQHGIGEYLGIKTLEVNGNKKDYLHLRYAGEDKLYIPVEQIDLIQKYNGVEGKRPRLHRLGSSEWQRTKKKVEKSVEDLARELLSLYQARKNMEGYAFSPDHNWQSEFEACFPYEETPDQLKAIDEVKKDLEKSYPMDRLVCGDVGYGKTEVALRAAFKVVMEGKQVVVLVPTTILAHQHYHNFLERFNSFPVEVRLLSRFLSGKEQNRVIKGLKQGTVDIVIGTHRLLSQDIHFNDLGLLVIDEEHRFGVRHKEKLKKMRLDVDVLTMTATPIPRTLHMSLAGSRDLSVIETPPENRYPIQTYVAEYNDQLIKDAITREINRKGQVYFVYNRVQDIEKWGKKIKELVPEARVAVGHGQMPEAQLEKLMTDFLNGEYDVLVSTTIIEAGLDISNVNTIIIMEADKFGLAQLYQLRGRVGRTNRYAYAYLTYRPEKVISEEAEKRLQAIKEFAQLGSGFKIALRDLEIRGAGNLLGAEQHGFMVSVGFDLYCQMLEDAVQKVKGEESKEEVHKPHLDFSVSAFIPSTYMENQGQKINIYRRVKEADEFAEIEDIEKELVDRFGALPREVDNLMRIARLRVLARLLRIQSMQQENGRVQIRFLKQHYLKGEDLWKLAGSFPGKIKYITGENVSIKVKLQEPSKVLEEVEDVLSHFYQKLFDRVY